MQPVVTKITELTEKISTATILSNPDKLSLSFLAENEISYVKKKLEKENECVVYKYPEILFFGKIRDTNETHLRLQAARLAGSKLFDALKSEKTESVQLLNFCEPELMVAFLEGLLLSGYSFSKYKKEKDDFTLKEVFIFDQETTSKQTNELLNLTQAVFFARDLVNEPLSFLTATQFSEEMEKLGEDAGFSVEVFNKQKIQSLKMGGLIAVNKGSIDPPTFNILEWKPENATNKKPVILVGKGVVYDTGGLSLKPTPKSMDYMKSDMAGAATVVSTLYATAKNKLPVHVIGLIPATDNRPDGNAYVPGDVITMFDGTTVEIKNTDAEGRLILADALSYAKKYSPELVINIATLTGAAEIVAGSHGTIGMGNTKEKMEKLKEAGEETYERIVEVPLWEEYGKPLKSAIADLNNLGAREAQSTIAGKFLEHFTSYDWIHLDSAGVSFLFEKDGYRPAGGTGQGVRLLYNFLKKFN
ncbi:leucyl aminopeptidase family protein [Maribellus maritimus]|uniref:leucyl aminopeptidase family protein n=1 Tax=Maribellus maritimus TaxID=2870838 RepID=UPI001EECA9FB|nr:leucyl aminopeptidase family protein [Maribellus maritimus]MCG6187224.1 leucyl aminopeptidase family protein [Maribellus maritimus]